MGATVPRTAQWGALLTALVALVPAVVFLGWRLATPAECAWLPPHPGAFAAEGVRPRAGESCPLPANSLVSGASVEDGAARYIVGGGVVFLDIDRDRGVLGDRLWRAGGTLLFVTALFGIGGYAVRRRPHDPAAMSALVFASALVGSTVVTLVGLPPTAAFSGTPRWVFTVCVQFVYTLGAGAVLAWALHFPAPLRPWLSGGYVWPVATWGPPLLWAAAAVVAGWGRPYHAWMSRSIPLQTGVGLTCVAAALVVVGFRIVRARGPGADPVQRQQLVWLGGSAIVSATLVVAFWTAPTILIGYALLPDDLIGLPGLLFVAGLAVAMLRFRLFDLDVVLARGLVFAGLSLLGVLTYLATVWFVTGIVSSGRTGGVVVVAAVVAAIVLNPVRTALGRWVRQAIYGEAHDPYRALSRLADLLQARDVDWDAVAADLRRALRVPYVRIAGAERIVAEAGRRPQDATALTVEPLRHRGQGGLGSLEVATRGRGERFTPAERRLLSDLGAQVASAVQQERLDHEVQASRERLVLAREEERRMLRRTLHDDIGPTLAALSLRAATVRALLSPPGPPPQAGIVLDRIERDAHEASDAVRRLAYDLRPPALDDRGLAAAVREQADMLAPLRVDVDVTGLDAPLPAGVEAAAYRIVVAALDNAVAHAKAAVCRVGIHRTGDEVRVTVDDDGVGLHRGVRAGVGITSMRERAAELGGSCVVESGPSGGTSVRAVLPVGGRS